MDGKEGAGRTRRWIASAGLVASGLVAGAILVGTHVAGAQSTPPSATPPSTTAPAVPGAPGPGWNGAGPGPGETLLTGDPADKVKTAALAAIPGGTIIRVETDSAGSPYEAHVRKSDGSVVIVKVDNDFKVTSTEDSFGGGPRGTRPSSTTATGA